MHQYNVVTNYAVLVNSESKGTYLNKVENIWPEKNAHTIYFQAEFPLISSKLCDMVHFIIEKIILHQEKNKLQIAIYSYFSLRIVTF